MSRQAGVAAGSAVLPAVARGRPAVRSRLETLLETRSALQEA